jgi:hypothetical protein
MREVGHVPLTEGLPVVKDERNEPKYRHLLRPIGAYLDTLNASNLLLAESEEGFIWRCSSRANPANIRFGVIGVEEIAHLAEAMKRHRLGRVPDLYDEPAVEGVCPYGYEELLRALSFKLDKEAATSVMVIEDDDLILVQFTLQVPTYVQMEPVRMVMPHYFHEDLLGRAEIEALVKQTREFRGTRFYR